MAERWGDSLDMPIMVEETQTAVHRGAGNKWPGHDGISIVFYKKNCSTIEHDMLSMFNQMYNPGNLMEQLKHGIVVCLPKTTAPKTTADYRSITLLNTDFNRSGEKGRKFPTAPTDTVTTFNLTWGEINEVILQRFGKRYVKPRRHKSNLFTLPGFHSSVRQDLSHISDQAAIGI